MDRDSIGWKGYWIAAPTPFTVQGVLDENALRSVLRLYHDQGVHGVLINGTTGEWFSQTEAERPAEVAVEELGGKIPVVVGCTTFTPSQTIALGLHAREIGADGMLSTPPPYVAPTPRLRPNEMVRATTPLTAVPPQPPSDRWPDRNFASGIAHQVLWCR